MDEVEVPKELTQLRRIIKIESVIVYGNNK